jgi:D-arabinose 1-dehydrogenase-like Zn-dependent alcohol dehydrogenase
MTMYSTADWDQGCLASHVAWDVSTLFHIPEEISSKDAGPLMCAGASVWGPLYSTGLRAGDRVGIIGVGGLGHLAIQFASKLGMVPVVFSRTDDKKQAALDFGAAEFHVTDDSADFSSIKKLQTLLITTSANPDLKKYVSLYSFPCEKGNSLQNHSQDSCPFCPWG